jgi:hypothetical protein
MILGLGYNRGSGLLKDEEVTYHELGIGLLFVTIYFVFY